jgi:hypothetical protein
MQTKEIIQGLRDEVERIRADAEARMSVIQSAIEQLESPFPPQSSSPPAAHRITIPEIIIKAAEALGDCVLDFKPLKAKAAELFPDQAEKIERGIYPAISSLTGRKLLIKVPGGWKLPKFVPNVVTP